MIVQIMIQIHVKLDETLHAWKSLIQIFLVDQVQFAMILTNLFELNVPTLLLQTENVMHFETV